MSPLGGTDGDERHRDRGRSREGRRPGGCRDARTGADADRDRGQTTQDFALGVGIFLVTVAFVFAFVPTVLVPFEAGPNEADAAEAQHLAADLTDNLTVGGYATRLNQSRTRTFFKYHNDSDDIRGNYSLPVASQANVTLENLEGTRIDPSANPSFSYHPRAGTQLATESTASASRVLEYDGDSYRLVVRVW
jgi:hypothetical protein